MITYGVFLDGKQVTPKQVQEDIGTAKGKSAFLLLPNGELRLRVYLTSENGYQFFNLPEKYEAVVITSNTKDPYEKLFSENDRGNRNAPKT